MVNLVTPEAASIFLNIVLAILGWRIKLSRDKAKSRAEDERVRRELAEAEIERVKTENKVKLIEAESKAKREAEQSQMLQQLQTERLDWLKQLQDQKKVDDENYKGLKSLQEDQTKWLTTEIQTQGRRNRKFSKEIAEAAVRDRAAMKEDIHSFIKGLSETYFAGLQTLGSEIGMTLARQMAIQNLDKELIPFPPAEDPRWKRVFVTPNKPDVWLFKQPRMYDDVRLQKPCAQIKADGHWVNIISNQLQDWLIVMKENGETCYGYLPAYAVKIHDTEPTARIGAPA